MSHQELHRFVLKDLKVSVHLFVLSSLVSVATETCSSGVSLYVYPFVLSSLVSV